MAEDTLKIALLIDGDNAQPRLFEQILSEASKYGKATIRRIYGDWTSPTMNGWKTVLNHFAIRPMQKFSYTTGKNSTDSALIIDAMDILHSGLVNGFCIVSSDSDYTGLAHRIREEGIFVMGIGQEKTPEAFVKACEIFIYTENLAEKDEDVLSQKSRAAKKTSRKQGPVKQVDEPQKPEEQQRKGKRNKPLNMRVINKAFEMVAMENETAYLADVGNALTKLDPSFDVRTYGFRSLAQLFKSIDNLYEVMPDGNGSGMFTYLVKRKTDSE